ncbi:MAG: DUF3592 domain-containing protein, partial [Anaerolineae bacterium]
MKDKNLNSNGAASSRPPLSQVLAAMGLFILGLALAVFLVYNLARDASLWVLGREVTAEVVSLWVEPIGDAEEGELSFRYYMEYRFETPGGRTITKTTRLDVREWGALQEGGPVRIVYFPLVPSHSRLEESRFLPALACAYVPLVVVA